MFDLVETDIVIVGGGIAGLWLLNCLRQQGRAAILLEANTLGGGQTLKAQGIIHGGTKYALQGAVTAATQSIADMPAVWQKCLEGTGEIDLTHVPILSQYQYLFSVNKLTGKLVGFFAGMALQGRVDQLTSVNFPEIFQHKNFKGVVYALHEMAIDTQALLRELVKPHQHLIFKIDKQTSDDIQVDAMGNITKFVVHGGKKAIQIKAKKYIFTAGAGNELILQKLQQPGLAAQRRPLHMVVVKTNFAYPVFAHCLGMGATPRITITTHKAQDGKYVWYLGGQIAEEGVKFDAAKQIAIAKKELQDIFSWLDFTEARFASFFVDRAEPLQAEGKRPDSSCCKSIGNVIVAWPTKLALAPKLSAEVMTYLDDSPGKQENFDVQTMREFSMPAFATPIWDELL